MDKMQERAVNATIDEMIAKIQQEQDVLTKVEILVTFHDELTNWLFGPKKLENIDPATLEPREVKGFKTIDEIFGNSDVIIHKDKDHPFELTKDNFLTMRKGEKSSVGDWYTVCLLCGKILARPGNHFRSHNITVDDYCKIYNLMEDETDEHGNKQYYQRGPKEGEVKQQTISLSPIKRPKAKGREKSSDDTKKESHTKK